MRISLVIATRDRRASLERCLEAVGHARAPESLEVIVVDNGSRDGTRAFLDEYARRAPFSLLVLSEPRLGKSNALNAALACATGDVIAFTDDDIYLAPDYFDRLVGIFDRGDIDYCGGRTLLYDPADLSIAIREETRMELIPPRSYVSAGMIGGCNMAFRRQVIRAIGGFDVLLGPGTPFICEDADIVGRASAGGWTGGYFPELLVYHHHGRRSSADQATLARGYNLGRGAYFAKFILNRSTRVQYLRRWYWKWGASSWNDLLQETWGALGYCWRRLVSPGESGPVPPETPPRGTRGGQMPHPPIGAS